jgi:hypothetical protein
MLPPWEKPITDLIITPAIEIDGPAIDWFAFLIKSPSTEDVPSDAGKTSEYRGRIANREDFNGNFGSSR